MDDQLHELESILSDHFGRTPSNSQEIISDDEIPAAEVEDDDVIGGRVRDYLEQAERTTDSDGSDIDDEVCGEFTSVQSYMRDGCGCKLQCNTFLNCEQIQTHILDARALSKDEKELNIMSLLKNYDTDNTKKGKRRVRNRNVFTIDGRRVCKTTFMLYYDIKRHQLNALVRHVRENGLTPRTHGNTGKKPKHAILFDDVMCVVRFIRNIAETRGLPQPAALRGRDNIPVIYLSSDTTKSSLHLEYTDACSDTNVRAVKLTAFKNIWLTCLPHVKIASPRDDVCARCEKLRRRVGDAVTEEEKLTAADALRDHVLLAQQERDVYNDCLRKSANSIPGDQQRYVHFTFDFSQNVSLPHYSRQSGPLYFLSLRKIQIFGVRVDSLNRQLNFLIDENETLGPDGKSTHGPDAVISMLDWVLQNFETDTHACAIHADNCPGQNKNRYVLAYFMWRVMTGQHNTIEYLMQVPGHARCLVDTGFAHIKMRYRRHDSETLAHLASIVDQSAVSNTAVCYPTWSWRRWKPFLEDFFKTVPGIRKFQYFRFDACRPGVVVMRTHQEAEEEEFKLLKNRDFRFVSTERPPVVQAAGLTDARRHYLRRSVRPYAREQYQDYYS